MIVVSCQHFQHGRQNRRSHNARVFAKRVFDHNRVAQRRILGQSDPVISLGADKTERGDLAASAGEQGFVDQANELLAVRQLSDRYAAEHSVRNVVVAVKACNLFRDIRYMLNIVSERRRNHIAVLVKCEFNLFQNLFLFFFAEINSDEIVDPFIVKLHFDRFFRLYIAVYNAVYNIAGVQFLHKLKRSFQRPHRCAGVKFFFIPAGGFRPHAQRLGGAPYRYAVETGGFKHNGRCVLHNAAVFAAHNAGNRNGLVLIRDHKHRVVQLALYAVQRCDLFAVPRVAHIHFVAFKIAQVKRVHRLAVFQHYIVCNIHNVADRPDAACAQPFPKPARAFLYSYILHHSAGISVAFIRLVNLHLQVVVYISVTGFNFRFVQLKRPVKSCRSLARKAGNGHAVAPV